MRSRKQKRSDVVAEDIEGVDKADSKPLATIEEQPEVETKKPAGREEDSDAEDFSQKGKKKKPQEKQVKATESKDEEEKEGDGAFKMKTAAQKKAEARDPRRKDKRLKTNLRAEKQEDKGKEVIAEPEAAVAEEEHEEEQDEREEGAGPTGQMEEPRKRRREGEEEAAEEDKDKKDKRGKRKTKNNRRRARDEALGKLAQHSVVSSQDSVTKKPVYGDRKKKRTTTHTAPQPVTVKTPEFDKTEPLPKESLPSETDTKTPAPSSPTLDMPTSLGDAPLNTTPTLPPASRECTPTLLSTPKLGARDQHRTSTTEHNDSPVAKPDAIAQESDTPMPFTQEKPTVNNYQEKEKQRQPLNQDISASMNKPEGQREEPRMIISLNDDVELNKSEKAWKLPCKTPRAEEVEENNPDEAKTQDLFKRVRGILNKLTPERFQSLMEQMTELQMIIDTEERLEGVIDLIFEKAISESKYSEIYAKMCLCHSRFKVPNADKPGESVTFRHLLLNRCQKEFEKDKDDEEIFEKKQKELDAVPGEEKHRLKEELEESKDKAKRRSLGNIKFIGELFKLKMLTEGIVHDCIIKLLKNHDEKSLECLCRLFEATGKDLDSKEAKGRMDMYFKQMENIQKESKAMIRCKLQDVLDLRENNWVPRRRIQGPKTIVQIHEDAKMEEHREEQEKKITKAPFGGGFNNTRLGPGGKTPAPSSLTPDMLPSLGDVLLKTTPTLPPSTAVNTNVKPPPATREYTPTLPSTPKFPDNTAATLPDPVSHLWVSEVDGASTNEHNDSPNTKPDVVAQERDVPTPMPPTQEKLFVNISASANKPEGQREEPRKITPNISLTDDAQLSKSEKAWKPSRKKPSREDVEENDPDEAKTQDLFKRVRGVLNKLTPERFQSLMNQMTELQRTIDTEERLKGIIDLIFEKAISESKYSEIYAKLCLCHSKFKVPNADKPGDSVTFRHLLLNRCQMEFEKDKDDEVIFEKKQKELDAVPGEEKHRLKEELEESKDKAKRRSLGNIKFIGELFKLKMLTEGIVYDCIVKLLKNHDEKSLACLCRLFETTGEGLDTEKAKERMDMYFKEMETIKKESKICSMIRCNLQDVLDLRGNNWVPRRGIQGPKTIKQIHAEAEMEEHREEMKHNSNKELIVNAGGRTNSHAQSRLNVPQDKGWNPSVPISTKTVPFDTSRLCKITKAPVPDFDNLWLGPGCKSMSAFTACWAKGCSGWTSVSGSVG